MDSPNLSKSKQSRQERGKAGKMRRILAAGEKLFSNQRFDGTTVQQVADEADVAVGTPPLLADLVARGADFETLNGAGERSNA
jgi:Bacterial regulatory proteins, tetR family